MVRVDVSFMDDVLKDRERKCKLGGEIQFAAIAAQVSHSCRPGRVVLKTARHGEARLDCGHRFDR